MNTQTTHTGSFDFATLALPWKLLITGFILLVGSGYLSAALNARLAVGLSPAAIAEHYGDKSLSAEERAMIERQGFVEEEFSLEDLDEEPAPHEDGHGAMDHGDEGAGMADGGVRMSEEHMPEEHHGGPADDTLPAQVLVQLSHVHWLGFSLLLLSVGALACLSRFSNAVKATLVVVLALSFFADIAGLNLTRFVSDSFAWLTMLAGILIGVCLAVVLLRVLWELWIAAPAGARAH